jgi:predicted small metal-binding protein
MSQVVNCPCGKTVRGDTEDELVAGVQEHVSESHPEMVNEMTREKILSMAEPG